MVDTATVVDTTATGMIDTTTTGMIDTTTIGLIDTNPTGLIGTNLTGLIGTTTTSLIDTNTTGLPETNSTGFVGTTTTGLIITATTGLIDTTTPVLIDTNPTGLVGTTTIGLNEEQTKTRSPDALSALTFAFCKMDEDSVEDQNQVSKSKFPVDTSENMDIWNELDAILEQADSEEDLVVAESTIQEVQTAVINPDIPKFPLIKSQDTSV